MAKTMPSMRILEICAGCVVSGWRYMNVAGTPCLLNLPLRWRSLISLPSTRRAHSLVDRSLHHRSRYVTGLSVLQSATDSAPVHRIRKCEYFHIAVAARNPCSWHAHRRLTRHSRFRIVHTSCLTVVGGALDLSGVSPCIPTQILLTESQQMITYFGKYSKLLHYNS